MDAVDAAFHATPRELFLREVDRPRASYDGPIEIGHGQTNSQPRTVAAMLRLLDVRPGQRVLDVGAGSGWTTALLAELTGPTGEVVGVELVQELAELGAANLAAVGRSWASIEPAAPGVLGDPARAPYDRILVSAAARNLPQPLVDQLADTGRMVIPVAGTMLLVVRDPAGTEVTRHGSYRFVPCSEVFRGEGGAPTRLPSGRGAPAVPMGRWAPCTCRQGGHRSWRTGARAPPARSTRWVPTCRPSTTGRTRWSATCG